MSVVFEHKYYSLIQHCPVCIHEIDLDGKFSYINPAGLKMVGLQSDATIIGTSYLDMISDIDRGRIKGLLDKAYQGESSDFEFDSTEINADLMVFSSCFIPIKSDSGAVVSIMGITRNITDQMDSEIKSKSRTNELESFNELITGREAQMIELKKEINALLESSGKEKKYSF
ncbi:MAG: PAS domain S-box-containing protein [Candidatus Omnitrophota bacterium]|jgi:PAS domain S-box-containing protein